MSGRCEAPRCRFERETNKCSVSIGRLTHEECVESILGYCAPEAWLVYGTCTSDTTSCAYQTILHAAMSNA